MTTVWYMDDDSSGPKNEHHKNPPEFISLEELFRVSGVECLKLNVETIDTDGKLDQLKKNRGYIFQDELNCSKEYLPNYDEKLKMFYKEHLHTDEEIRLIIEGSGYFDVRDKNDQWIRIKCTPGDLLVLPSGIYHRFTLDERNYVKIRRFFTSEPVWAAYNRPSDDMECRKNYLNNFQNGQFIKVQRS